MRMMDRSIGGGGVMFLRDFAQATYNSIPEGDPFVNGVEDGDR